MSMTAISDPRTDVGARQILDELRRIAAAEGGAPCDARAGLDAVADRAQRLSVLTGRVRSAFFRREADRVEREFSFLLKSLVLTRTLGEALQEYLSFIDCFWSGVSRTEVTVMGERVFILPNNDASVGDKLFLHELRSRSIVLGAMKWLCGGSLTDPQGHFLNAPIDKDKIAAVFPYPVVSAGDRDGISFRAQDLGRPVIRAPGEIPEFVRAAPMIALAGFGARPSYSQRVTTVVTRFLQERCGTVSASAVCRQLGVSQATLHRKLAAEGTSFRELRDAAVNAVAKDLLRRTDAASATIAELLGYSDDGAFRRSFRRWNGCSPAAYRRAPLSTSR